MSGLGLYCTQLFQAAALLIFGGIFLFLAVSTVRIVVLGARRLCRYLRQLSVLKKLGVGVLVSQLIAAFYSIGDGDGLLGLLLMSLLVPGLLSGIIWAIDLAPVVRKGVRALPKIWRVVAIGLALDLSLELVRHL